MITSTHTAPVLILTQGEALTPAQLAEKERKARVIKHVYNDKMTSGKWTVNVSPTTNYGYFENDVTGSGGGLWFEKKRVEDYDGVGCLPLDVVTALRRLGYVVPRSCY